MVKLVSHKQVSYSFHTLVYAVHKSRNITANIVILNFRISIKQRKGILSEFADFFFFFFFFFVPYSFFYDMAFLNHGHKFVGLSFHNTAAK